VATRGQFYVGLLCIRKICLLGRQPATERVAPDQAAERAHKSYAQRYQQCAGIGSGGFVKFTHDLPFLSMAARFASRSSVKVPSCAGF
jgi:hypothetical protein